MSLIIDRFEDADVAVLENYDCLPDSIKAELPLKRIWTLVPEGADSE